ncbi:unnamed protein product [Staurois parvus]|uniref:Secreted protein n=1 Tax=Staurois parvus TaxID=386267 RepID=A0ABN9HVC6_9NEOB|nr:unnamed protein product [Staurois parvus]
MYVKCFDTVMFYYVIFSVFSECHFLSFSNFPRRERNPDDRCRHPPDYIAGDTAGGTSWERRTR